MTIPNTSHTANPVDTGWGCGRLRRQRDSIVSGSPLAAILTYILLYLTLKETIIRMICLKAIVLLFCFCGSVMAMLLVARNRIDVVRMRKREVQERHDYNYAMYRTLYKKKEKLRSITLHSDGKASRSNCTVRRWHCRHWMLVKRKN